MENIMRASSENEVQKKSAGALSFWERMAFGCGDLANNVIYSAISTFLIFYGSMQNVVGCPNVVNS